MSDQPTSVSHPARVDEAPAASPLDSLWAIVNVFIDPASSVRHLRGKSAWVVPLIVVVCLIALGSWLNGPFTRELIQSRILAQGKRRIRNRRERWPSVFLLSA